MHLPLTCTFHRVLSLFTSEFLRSPSAIRCRLINFQDRVCVALAGRASEQINFGKVTTGASDDLKRVTEVRALSVIISFQMYSFS